MNRPWLPDGACWLEWLLMAAVGSTVLVAVGVPLARIFRETVWQRTAWQAVIMALAVLAVAGWLGVGPAAAGLLRLAWAPAAQAGDQFRNPGPLSTAAAAPSGSATIVAGTAEDPCRRGTQWLAAIWGAGIAVVFVQILRTHWRLAQFRRHRTTPVDEACARTVSELATRLKVRRPVALLQAKDLRAPVAFGWLRPTLVFPQDLVHDLSRKEHASIVAHELAHLASGDPGWQLLADLTCAIWWWQPLAWKARRRLRSASEAAADEASLLVPGGPAALAACLVDLGRRMTIEDRLGWVAFEGASFRSSLGRRVERLMRLSAEPRLVRPARFRATVRMGLGAILVVAGVGGWAWASPRASLPPEETTLSILQRAWRNSLAGMALTFKPPQEAGPSSQPGTSPETGGQVAPPSPHRAPLGQEIARLNRRLSELENAVARLAGAGRVQEADSVTQNMKSLQARAGAQPLTQSQAGFESMPLWERQRRVFHLLTAAENLRAAGMAQGAQRLVHMAQQVAHGGPAPANGITPGNAAAPGGPGWSPGIAPGEPFPPRLQSDAASSDPPYPPPLELVPAVLHELRNEIRQMHRQMEEMRPPSRTTGERERLDAEW